MTASRPGNASGVHAKAGMPERGECCGVSSVVRQGPVVRQGEQRHHADADARTPPTTPSTRPVDGQHDIARHQLLPQSVADEALRDDGAVRRQVPGQVGSDRPVLIDVARFGPPGPRSPAERADYGRPGPRGDQPLDLGDRRATTSRAVALRRRNG